MKRLVSNTSKFLFASIFAIILGSIPFHASAQAPVNDDCSGAITLNVDTICAMDTFDNFNATASAGVPNPTCGFYQGGDVWFKVTVPSSGNVRFEVRNVSGINPQYALYTGNCGSLTQYSCNQLDADRTISDPSLANQTLYIRVYKYNNASGGTFQICVWEPPVPANDLCADAIMLNVGTSCNKVSYTSLYSTGESISVAPNPTCGFYQGGDVWFKFVMPASGVVRFELTGQSPQYAVYSGSCGSFTQLHCAQLNAETMLVDTSLAGDTLYLRTYRYNSEEGGNFDICIWEPTIPANNDCGDAIMLSVGTTCSMDTFTNAYATKESTSVAPNPTCGFYQGGDVWFKFVAPASGIFRVERQNMGSNAQFAVYSGSCGSFTQEMCAQLDAGRTVINPSLGGDTLYLRVYSYNSEEGGGFSICIWEPDIPVNDNCADAIWLNTGTSCSMDTFTNAYASAESTSIAPNPTCGFYQGGDVWFKFVMPASGNLRVEKQNLGTNAQYAVYSGSCGSFTQLFCAQLDAGKTYLDSTVAGDTLYLRVYNYNNDEGGVFSICVWDPPIPVNNHCADAIPLTVGSSCVPANFTNRYSTNEPTSVAPNPGCGFYNGADVWFTVQMPSSGLLTIQRQNLANVNAQMALYSGTCGSFTQLACAQLNSTLNFADTSLIGQTLYLRIFSYNSDEGGEFNLCAFNPSPAIIAQSNDTIICDGNNAYFAVTATNATNYQWQEYNGSVWSNISNGGVYSGATTATLNFTNVPASLNGYQYRCIVSGIVSPPDVSTPVTLTVGTAPLIISAPGNIPVYTPSNTCNAIGYYSHTITGTPNPFVSYNFSGATIGSGVGNGSGKYFGIGVTTVIVSASNICGADSAGHTVTVIDTLDPVIYCPANITLQADNGNCSASNVNLTQPTYADACGIDTLYNNAPATFPVGTTVVTWTIVDNNGNSATCNQNVTVIDTTAPTITCTSSITVSSDSGLCTASNVVIPQPSFFDPCGIDTIFSNAPPVYGFGNTVVTITVRDNNGNTSSCLTNVNVTDTQPPFISPGPDIEVEATSPCTGTIVTPNTPTVSDNCGVDSVWDDAPAVFPLGDTKVTITAIDASNNTATASYNVRVKDTTPPTINAGQDFTVAESANCSVPSDSVNFGVLLTVSDNCGIDTTYHNAPQFFSLGTTEVIWTTIDGSGNVATDTIAITVIDTTVPTVICPADITVNAVNGTCTATNVNLGTPTVTDNCSTSVSNNAPSSYPVGVTNVIWTATDNSNNTSSCTQTVTVVDNQAPNAVCKNHTVTLVNGTATISVSDINNGSSDNCGIDTMYLSQTTYTTADIGNNTVMLTVVDVNGNSSTCTGVVTVQSGGNNNMSCSISVTPANNIYTGGNPNNIYIGYGPQAVALTANVTGGSGGYTYSWAGSNLSCGNCQAPTFVPQTAGTYVFTLTVKDNNNNTTTCNVSICVQDIRVQGKGNNNKVYICHNNNTLKVSVNAVNTHLSNHNDFLGKCEDEGCNSASKGDKDNDEETIFGVQEIVNNVDEFKLFPNPNDGTFKLELTGDITEGTLTVMDMLGKVVKRVLIDKNSNLVFSMPEIADGVYMVEVKNGEDVHRKRMVIKR